MSVIVKDLSKLYGPQKAVDQLSFELKKGEILGFLGPNGAGKTTTMKILTCFIPQSSGVVKVCGLDVAADPIGVRRKIGYLPEHNPLYKDMYVKEYLQFVGGVYGMGRQLGKRVAEMIEMTGLKPESHKRIGQLSKGYRQRVGLAQAMIHDPEVLILDEPTSGLDPNQLEDIRGLILELGRDKTVILSTHIMQEVQALCSRVIIIDKGRMVADDAIGQLRSTMDGRQQIEFAFKDAVETSELQTVFPDSVIESMGENAFRLQSPAGQDMREAVFNYAVQNNRTLLRLQASERDLESVFKQLTRKS